MTLGLKSSEVIKIIKQCGESGVKNLKYLGLELEFNLGHHSIVQPGLFQEDPLTPPYLPHNPYSHQSEQDLGMLELEDPLSAEHLMENGLDSDT